MENPFHNFFKSFLKKEDQSVLGIDIGSASIKVVQIRRRKGQAVLETYGELALGPYGGIEIGRAVKLKPEQIVDALNDVLKEANTSTTNCAVAIPMKSSMVSVMKIPTLDESQLPKMIPIEARKYIPVPISEVALDWFIIPKIANEDDENKMAENKTEFFEALVVAIHNNVLNDFNSIVTNAKLSTSFFEVEMFSTIRSVIDPRDNSPIMICDIGAGATKLYIVERGIVRDSHIINRGSQDVTLNISKSMGVDVSFSEKLKRNFGKNTREQDEQIGQIIELVMSPIFSDTNTVMMNYQKKSNKNIGKVILVGGGAMIKGLKDQAQNQLGIPVENGQPFGRLEAPAFLQGVLENTGLAFSTAIGLALRELQELD
ncbi:type IV pilus assembly protein PilM [Candidatus Nomurabacteria bacterium]|nr:type IV pilus assembly protein PilM [Candidatus Nomurabacteria bacterium]